MESTLELSMPEDDADLLAFPLELFIMLCNRYFDTPTLWTFRNTSKLMRSIASETLLDSMLQTEDLKALMEYVQKDGKETVELDEILALYKHIDGFVVHENGQAPLKTTERIMEWTEYPTTDISTNEMFQLQEEFRRVAGRSGRVPSRLYYEWTEQQDRLTRNLRREMAKLWNIASDWNNHRLFPFTAAENKAWKARREAKQVQSSLEQINLAEQRHIEHMASYNPRAGLQIRFTKRAHTTDLVDHLVKFAALQRAYSIRFPPTLTHEQRKRLHEKAEELRNTQGQKIYTKSFGQASARFLIAYRS
jgi:hypothetical protein